MATLGVKAIGPLTGNDLSANIFQLVSVSNDTIGRSVHSSTLPTNTLVLVDEVDLVPVWTSSGWNVVIPDGTSLVVKIGNDLKIAETAQPIQVTGPTISILDLES